MSHIYENYTDTLGWGWNTRMIKPSAVVAVKKEAPKKKAPAKKSGGKKK